METIQILQNIGLCVNMSSCNARYIEDAEYSSISVEYAEFLIELIKGEIKPITAFGQQWIKSPWGVYGLGDNKIEWGNTPPDIAMRWCYQNNTPIETWENEYGNCHGIRSKELGDWVFGSLAE